jgi:hypothetical protein
MKRGTGMLKASISLTLLLGSIACTAAAEVTHGDLLLVRRIVGNGTYVQFHAPTGKLKAAVDPLALRVGGNFGIVWAHTISQDGRYAAIGCYGGRPNYVQIVFLQLTGASPKVLGSKTLPGVNAEDPTSCYRLLHVPAKTLALKSRPLAGGAGAVLDVYLSIWCQAAGVPLGCEAIQGASTDAAAVQHWSVVHRENVTTLGPLTGGDRAFFSETSRCGGLGLSVAVTANGKVYAAFGFTTAKGRLRRSIDTVGTYEVRRNPRDGTRLIPTWKFQTRPLSVDVKVFVVSGPITGCALGWKTTATGIPGRADTRVYSFAKGRAPYIGGIRIGGRPFFYNDISCKGSGMYATLDGNEFSSILKVSNKELKQGAAGRVVFQTPPIIGPQVLTTSIVP